MSEQDFEVDGLWREWGAQQRDTATLVRIPVERLTSAGPRRRPVAAMLCAAAVVLVLAAAIAIFAVHAHPGAHPQPTAGATLPPVPAGDRLVDFHGLTIDIPAEWPINATRCGIPTRDTVVFPGVLDSCLAGAHPGTTSVTFEDGVDTFWLPHAVNHAVEVGGRPAMRRAGAVARSHVIVIVVPTLSATVVISAPTAARADALAATASVANTDPNGCAARDAGTLTLPTGRPPARAGADRQLIPGHPDRVALCRYVGGLLEQGATTTAGQRASLIGALNSLPAGLSRARASSYADTACANPDSAPGPILGAPGDLDSEAYVVLVSYPSGPGVTITARLGLCRDLGASNGTRTGQRTFGLIGALTASVGNADGFPGHVHPAG
jgi:hypothetical protein